MGFFVFWWFFDDHLAAAANLPALGHLPWWVVLLIGCSLTNTVTVRGD